MKNKNKGEGYQTMAWSVKSSLLLRRLMQISLNRVDFESLEKLP